MESTQQPVGTDVRNPTAFVTLAATALAIFVGGLLFAPIDPITKAWLLAVLIVAIWIDAVSYAGGFRLVSAQLQARRYAHAVRLNSSLVLDLDGIVSRSLRVFGTKLELSLTAWAYRR